MHIKKTFSFYALREVMPLNNSLKNDTDDDTFDLESATQTDIEARGGHLGIFWVGMCRPGLQNGTPFWKKFPLKLIPRSRNGPIF